MLERYQQRHLLDRGRAEPCIRLCRTLLSYFPVACTVALGSETSSPPAHLCQPRCWLLDNHTHTDLRTQRAPNKSSAEGSCFRGEQSGRSRGRYLIATSRERWGAPSARSVPAACLRALRPPGRASLVQFHTVSNRKFYGQTNAFAHASADDSVEQKPSWILD